MFQKSMSEIGCTTPFGINTDYICTDSDKSKRAMEIYVSPVSVTSHTSAPADTGSGPAVTRAG